jgi:NADH-quinone oxidoreductase subunit E
MNHDPTDEEQELLNDVAGRLTDFAPDRSSMIPVLQMIQERCQYLPPAALEMAAEHLGVTRSEVYGVATFYNQFRFHPPGRRPIKVCLGTACHVCGGDIILENFERKLEIKAGETTEDREYSIDRVACVGCCALAPVAVVGETVYGKMAPSKVEGLLMRFGIQDEQERKRNEQQ